MMDAFSEYIASLKRELAGGAATENTYRPALKALLEASEPGISATNEPKRTQCGAPDFSIKHKNVLLGYVETKGIATNLEEMERGKVPYGDQFNRYREGLPNWLLTDYLDFHWWVNGKKRLTVRLADLDAKGKIIPTKDGEEKLARLLHAFFSEPALTVATAKDLATSMAHMTRIVRELIIDALKREDEETERRVMQEKASRFAPEVHARGPWLREWLSAFRETLIPDLDEKQFADMFAQTLAYGLFAARVHIPPDKEFSRETAAFNLPKTNPFLRKLFQEIAGEIPNEIEWAVEDIVELLKHSNMAEILKDFGKGLGKEDPVVHFYETFLAAYDPKMRELRGVYYTPEPVVSYIVRSIDHLLKTRFNRPKGLADENTLILDPATGTGTFLYFVIDQIHQQFAKQKGAWDAYVSQHLLNRIFGFELLMAPYAVAHLKLGMQLEQTGYKFGSDQRLGIFLTNTLEEAAKKSDKLFASWVSDEANAASRIKRDEPILVVLGNPPYSNFGRMNRGKWILSLLDDYKRDLQEKKLNLDDDFIKFIRFAQWRIEQTGHGIIGLITNNVYLDGITHRRMRELLLNSFDSIFILNLHGNLRKKENTPTGNSDANVFDIQQGVAIGLFTRNTDPPSHAIYYADVWGSRANKYEILEQTDAASTQWRKLKPVPPHFFFVPVDTRLGKEYENYHSLKNVFLARSEGIMTSRDEFIIRCDRAELITSLEEFRDNKITDEEIAERFGLRDTRGWSLREARRQLAADKNYRDNVTAILAAPFDLRFIQYSKIMLDWPRIELMQNLLKKQNIALLTTRQTKDDFSVLVSDQIARHKSASRYDKTFVFPLYLYSHDKTISSGLFSESGRNPNINDLFLKAMAEQLALPREGPFGLPRGITAEDIFNYAYAIFHSSTYRKRYAEFLKIDFPRLPLTSNIKLFRGLAAKGAELVALHLLEASKVNNFITGFPEKGDNVVEKVQYMDKDKRVWINKAQYFSTVPKAVWEFHIGGYKVCEKWLKDRKGRKLSYDDIQHYQKVLVALNETIRLMAEIDKLIPSWPIN